MIGNGKKAGKFRSNEELSMAGETVIFKCRSGSHLYGTVTENSDLDLRGVFIGGDR